MYTAYSGGSGISSDPYRISTREDLEAVNDDLAAHYILMNDIDLAGTTYNKAVIAPDYELSSYFSGIPFTGSFNGGGKVIYNLTIASNHGNYRRHDNFKGLFGTIGDSGSVISLGLENCSVSGADQLGGLAGSNRGSISCSYSIASVNAHSHYTVTHNGIPDNSAGGLVGRNSGSINNSYSVATVKGDTHAAGGLVGLNVFGNISNCHSASSVNDSRYTGGLIGYNADTVTNSYFRYDEGLDNGIGTALSDAQMHDPTNFIEFDFAGQNSDGIHDFWYMPTDSYPILAWQNGTIAPPLFTYTVTFDLGDYAIRTGGGELVQIVEAGQNAELPVLDIDQGWVFTDWDGKHEIVFSDRTITAKYIYIWAAGYGSADNPYQIIPFTFNNCALAVGFQT